MFDEPQHGDSLIRRLLADPVALRRRARIALGMLAAVVVLSRLLPSGALAEFLTALLWICVPFIAFAIGFGDAFFIQHGRGQRRALLTMVGAILLSLLACVALSVVDGTSATGGEIVEGLFYGLLYAAVTLGLASAIALAIGRGSDYAARRIEQLSDEGW